MNQNTNPQSQAYTCECRLCANRDRFSSTLAIENSDWTEVSPLSVRTHDGWVRRGYCPGHSLADANEGESQ